MHIIIQQYQVDEKAILNCSKYFAHLAEGALKEILDKNYTPIKKARSATKNFSQYKRSTKRNQEHLTVKNKLMSSIKNL